MTPDAEFSPLDTAARQRWMAALAKASPARLEAAWNALGERPGYGFLRPPEVGSALVRARAGGTGRRFNMGEMTVTRCVVRLDGGATGVSYVSGRDRRHAELAALFDALMQDPRRQPALHAELIAPIEVELTARRDERARKSAATRVDFFTMVRGEG